MNPRPTKRLKEGMLVTYKRGWIVPCGPKDKPQGVWREGQSGDVRMLDGQCFHFCIPCGIQYRGDCLVRAVKP